LSTERVVNNDTTGPEPCGELIRYGIPGDIHYLIAGGASSHDAALWRHESELQPICSADVTVLSVHDGEVEAFAEFAVDSSSSDASACESMRFRFRIDSDQCVSNLTWSAMQSISSGGCIGVLEPWQWTWRAPEPPGDYRAPPKYNSDDEGGGWSVPLFLGGGGSCCCCVVIVILCLCAAGSGRIGGGGGGGGGSSSNADPLENWRVAQAGREEERRERQERESRASGNSDWWTPTHVTPTQPESNS